MSQQAQKNASSPPNKGSSACAYCQENVNSVKILACGHEACLKCLETWLKGAGKSNLRCPSCKKAIAIPENGFQSLSTKFFGDLTCDFCSKIKDVEEFWWCETCIKVFCSRCDVTNHRKLNHPISPWDTNAGIKFSLGFLTKFEETQKNFWKQAMDRSSKVIDEFLEETKACLESKLKDQKVPDLDKVVATRDVLASVYSIPEGDGKSGDVSLDLMSENNRDKMNRVIDQALKLSKVESEPFRPDLNLKTITGFGIRPAQMADYLWDRAVIEHTKESVDSSDKTLPEPAVENTSVTKIVGVEAWSGHSALGMEVRSVSLSSEVVVVVCGDKAGVWRIQKNNELQFCGVIERVKPDVNFLEAAADRGSPETTVFLTYAYRLPSDIEKEMIAHRVGICVFRVGRRTVSLLREIELPTLPKKYPLKQLALCTDNVGSACFLGTSWWWHQSDNGFNSTKSQLCLVKIHKVMFNQDNPAAAEIDYPIQNLPESAKIQIDKMACGLLGSGEHIVAVIALDMSIVVPVVSLMQVQENRLVKYKEVTWLNRMSGHYTVFSSLSCFHVEVDGDIRVALNMAQEPCRTLGATVYSWVYYITLNGEKDGTERDDGLLMLEKKLKVKGNMKGVHGFCFIPRKQIRAVKYLKEQGRPEIQDLAFTWEK